METVKIIMCICMVFYLFSIFVGFIGYKKLARIITISTNLIVLFYALLLLLAWLLSIRGW